MNPLASATLYPSTPQRTRETFGFSRQKAATHASTREPGNRVASSTNGVPISPESKLHVARASLPRSGQHDRAGRYTALRPRRGLPIPPVPRRNFRDPLPRFGPPATSPRQSRAISKPDAMRLTAWLPLAVLSAFTILAAPPRARATAGRCAWSCALRRLRSIQSHRMRRRWHRSFSSRSYSSMPPGAPAPSGSLLAARCVARSAGNSICGPESGFTMASRWCRAPWLLRCTRLFPASPSPPPPIR